MLSHSLRHTLMVSKEPACFSLAERHFDSKDKRFQAFKQQKFLKDDDCKKAAECFMLCSQSR